MRYRGGGVGHKVSRYLNEMLLAMHHVRTDDAEQEEHGVEDEIEDDVAEDGAEVDRTGRGDLANHENDRDEGHEGDNEDGDEGDSDAGDPGDDGEYVDDGNAEEGVEEWTDEEVEVADSNYDDL